MLLHLMYCEPLYAGAHLLAGATLPVDVALGPLSRQAPGYFSFE
jgi:hypothetical protein